MPTAQTCRLDGWPRHISFSSPSCYLNYSTQNDCDSSSSILLYYDNVTFNTSKGCLELVKPVFKIKTLFLPLILFPLIIHTGCLKKLCFTELNISRFVTNIISISFQLEARSPKAQFGKTFLRHLLYSYSLCCSNEKMINPGGEHSRVYIGIQLLDQREGGGQRPQHWRWDHSPQVFIEGQLRSISEAGRYIQFWNSSLLFFGRAY